MVTASFQVAILYLPQLPLSVVQASQVHTTCVLVCCNAKKRRMVWGRGPQQSLLTCHQVSACGSLSSLLTDKRKARSCQLGESATGLYEQAGGIQLIEGNEEQSVMDFLRVPGWGPAKDPSSPWFSYSLSLKCIIHGK